MSLVKGDKKIINGWAFYDWANSVYPLVISTALFPQVFEYLTSELDPETGEVINDQIQFFGMTLSNTAMYSYVVSLGFLIVSVLSPILSGIADYSGNKKRFLQFFCYLGAISVACLYFFDPEHLEISMLPVMTACIGFWGSLVFYNAYLPEIAHEEDQDRVSAKGFSLGYIGSSVLLIICLIPILMDKPNFLMWAKLGFLVTALWWVGFAQVTYRVLPNNVYGHKPTGNPIKNGFGEIIKVTKQLVKTVRLKRYLIAFFIFSMGVQTVMLMASLFAIKEIDGMGGSDLIIAILIIQFLGAGGAWIFSKSSSKWGNIPVLKVVMFLWVLVVTSAWFIHSPVEFYIVAACVGLVMGGTQSLARSTYSKFLPETEDHASFFSYFDVLEKVGIVIGTFGFGFIEQLTGSMRASVMFMAIVFALGAIALFFVPKKEVTIAEEI